MIIFTSKNNRYIYNQFTNDIFVVPDEFNTLKDSEIQDELSPFLETKNISFESPNLENSDKTRSLIINITNYCNMRCSYCAYSEHYPFERKHENRTIDFDVVKKAIDEYVNRSEGIEFRHISMYGGEPSTEPHLVSRIIEYAKKKSSNFKFSVCTNGYSMSNEWIQLLVKNEALLQISIDGDKESHDRYRIDKNGRGSFDRIVSNLNKLSHQFPAYYKTCVYFVVTLSPPYRLTGLYEFYNNNELFHQPWYINFVKPTDTTFIDSLSLSKQDFDFSSQELYLANEYINASINGDAQNHFGYWVFGELVKGIHLRESKPGNKIWINGCCNPGVDKLFVDCNGDYYPCERSGSFMKLGDVEVGVDIDKSKDIVKQYTEDCNINCKTCPNMRFCDACYLGSKKGYEFELSTKYEFCQKRVAKLKLALYIYCSVLEINNNAFDIFTASDISI
ncbi:radical SAM protein [Photobacterium leiognathi]|uniref:radical SAM protein n=1 Tax=Photobacterium leiognathi TaxID=553611 RepID=UPI003AF35E47